MEVQETPVITIEIPPDYGDKLVALESEALSQSEQVRAMKATDQDSYNQVVEQGRTIATFIDKVEKWFEQWIAPLREPLDAIYEARKSVLDLAKEDKKHLAREAGAFMEAQERERRRIEAELAAAARKREEEERLQNAIKAETAGLKPAAVERILTMPSAAAAPLAAPTYQKAQGVSGRKTWFAAPVDDDPQAALKALVQAAATNDTLLPYLQVNQPALNKRASIAAFDIPGFEAKYTTSGSFRKGA